MASAVRLREDYSAAELRALARRSKDANQSRRLLSLAAVRDGMDRGSAAKIGGMDRQTLRDWVHRFNESGLEDLVDNWTEGPKPRLSAEQLAQFAQIVEGAGPDREKDGVVRWRRLDLKRVIAERSASTFIRAISESFCRSLASRTSAPGRVIRLRTNGSSRAFKETSRVARRLFSTACPRRRRSKSGSRCYAAGASARLESPTSGTGALTCRRMFAIRSSISLYRTELSPPGSSRIVYPETTRLSFIVWKRATAQACLLSPACATGWILRMTRLRLSSAALRPGRMDFGCIDFLTAHGVINSTTVEPTSILVTRGARRAQNRPAGRCRAPSRLGRKVCRRSRCLPDRGRAVRGRGRRDAAASGAGIPGAGARAQRKSHRRVARHPGRFGRGRSLRSWDANMGAL